MKVCAKSRRKASQPSTLQMRKTANSKQKLKNASSPCRETSILSAAPGIATKSCITSAGETLPDGTIIEPVAGSTGSGKLNLLLWTGSKATVGPRVEHGGCVYEAAELPPSLYRAIRFPSHCDDYGSARVLFDSISDLITHHFDLPERESNLLACFPISTWLADSLLIALTLAISGPDPELAMNLMRLLDCLCRHPLMLGEITPGGFRSLPWQLSLTLLLHQQGLKPNMQRLLRASSYRGLHLPGNGGSVVDPYGPKAILCGNDAALDTLGGGVIHISAAPSQLQSSALDEQVQMKIANDFQPRLLRYRLENLGKLRESPVDVSTFTFTTRPLARTLAACFPEDPELARDAVELLRPQDEELRGRRSCDVNIVIVEILWGMIHDGKQREVRVDALAKDVSALLRSRGETLTYNAEDIGWKLRGLNIPRHSSSSGRQVLLGRDTSQSVHRLAHAYGLPCTQRVEANCPDCNQAKPALSK
jgi:hypothetical protein